MNPKSMLRRTLAMLLVLIFALSNMGLAEMADAIADGIPAEAPQIEEIAEEAAPVEGQAEEAAPAEEEPAPAEEAPAEAPVVAVEAYQIDETSLYANAAVENFDGELAYQWEIAGEDGEWTAIDGATGSVYTTEADDRLAQSYRCVVTAGDVAAASEATGFDPDAYDYGIATVAAEEPVLFDASIDMVQANGKGNGDLSNANVTITNNAGSPALPGPIAIDPDGTFTLKATFGGTYESTFGGGEQLSYAWNLGDGAANVDEDDETKSSHTGKTTETAKTDTIKLKLSETGKAALKANPILTLTGITVTATTTEGSDPAKQQKASDAVSVTLVAKVTSTAFQNAAVTITPTDEKSETAYKAGSGKALKLAVTDYEAYKPYIKYAVKKSSGDDDETRKMGTLGANDQDTITLGGSLTLEKETTYYVQATLDKACTGDSDAVTTAKSNTFTVKPAAESIALDQKSLSIVADDTDTEFTLTADTTPGDAYTADLKWSVSTEASLGDEAQASDYVSVEQVAEKPTQAKVKLLPAAASLTADTNFTITCADGEAKGESTLTVKKALTEADGEKLGAAITFSASGNITDAGVAMQPKSGVEAAANDITLSLAAGDYKAYENLVKWSVEATDEGTAKETFLELRDLDSAKKIGIKPLAAESEAPNEIKAETGLSFTVTATIGTVSGSKTLTIKPEATKIEIKLEGEGLTEGADQKLTTIEEPLTYSATMTPTNAWSNGLKLTIKKNTEQADFSSASDATDEDRKDDTQGGLTFTKAGFYQVSATATGYDGTPAITPIVVKVQHLMGEKELVFDETQYETVLVGPEDSMVVAVDESKQPKEATTTKAGLKRSKYVWDIKNNAYGSSQLPYVEIVSYNDGTEHAMEEDTPWTLEQINATDTKSITLKVPDGMNNSTTKDIIVTAKTDGLVSNEEAGTKTPGRISATHSFKVMKNVTTTLKDSDIDFPDEIPLPTSDTRTYDPEDDTKPWNKWTKIQLKSAYADYPVDWKLVTLEDDGSYADADGAYDNWLTLGTDGILTLKGWYSISGNLFDKTTVNGKDIYIEGTVTVASSGEKTTQTIHKHIVLRPEPDHIDIQLQTSATGTATTMTIGDNDAYKNNIPVGSNAYLTARLGGPMVEGETDTEGTPTRVEVTAFGASKNATWTIWQRELRADPEAKPAIDEDQYGQIELTPTSQGFRTLPTASTGKFKIKVEGETGTGSGVAVFDVQQRISKADLLIGGAANRNYVIAGKPVKLELELTGADGTDKDLYTDNITWSIGSGLQDDVRFYAVGADGNKDDTHEYTKKADGTIIPQGVTAFYMDVPAGYEPDSSTILFEAYDNDLTTGGKLTHNNVRTSQRVLIKKALETSPFVKGKDGNSLTLERDEAGQNSTVKASLNAETLAALRTAGLSYKFVIECTDSDFSTKLKDETELAKWVEIDESSGLITIKPQESGDKPANEIPAADADDAVEFTVKAVVVGYEDGTWSGTESEGKHEQTLTVYHEADDVKLSAQLDRLNGYEGVESDKDTLNELPKAISVGNRIIVKADVKGSEKVAGKDETTPVKSAANVKLTATYGSGVAGVTTLTDGSLQIDAKRAGLITIVARSDDKISNNLNKSFTIEVIHQDITPANGKTDCAGSDTKAHKWVLAPADEQDNPDGHIYKCSVCGTKSNPVAHSATFDVNVTPTHAKDPDYDVFAYESGANGEITCKYCGYACEHEYYMDSTKTTLTRVDNADYHEGVCPTCGQTIKQKHVDGGEDRVCDYCGATSANAYFVADAADEAKDAIKEIVVPVGQKVVPVLKVDGVDSWSVAYKTDDASEQYVKLVSAATGELQGIAPIPETAAKKTVTLTADIVVYTRNTTDNTVKEEKTSKTIDVRVTADPATVTVTAEKDYVMYDSDNASSITNPKALVKLTAEADIANPDWTNYQWVVTATKGKTDEDGNELADEKISDKDAAAFFKFYTSTDGKTFQSVEGDATNPEIWVAAGKDESSKTGRLLIKYEYQPQEDDTAEKATTFEPVQIDVLAAFNKSDSNKNTLYGLTLSKEKVIQGDTITVDESAVDPRYGTIEYSIEVEGENKNTNFSDVDLNETLLSKWATVSGKTIDVKAAGLENKFAAPKTTQDITVTAGIYEDTDDDSEPDALAERELTFTVVQKPDHINVLYAAANGKAIGEITDADWENISKVSDLSFNVGDEIYVKTQVCDKDDKEITGDTIDHNSVTWEWPAEGVVKHENANATTTSEGTDEGVYRVTFLPAAGSKNVQIVAKNPIKDVTVNIPVKPLISSIVLSANTDVYVPGETITNGAETTEKTVVIDYTITPADTGDEISWVITDLDGKPVQSTTVACNKVSGKNQVEVAVDSAMISEKMNVTIVAKSATQVEVDGKKEYIESNPIKLTIYKAAGPDALLLETEDGRTGMSVGETLQIVKHEYDVKNGYNSTIPLDDIVVTNELDEKNAAMEEGKHVISVDPETFVITAENPGSATIELHAYNWNENKDNKASLSITVEPAATDIEFNADIKDPAEYEMTVGKRPYQTFRTTDFTAVRAIEGEGTSTTEPVRSAQVELVSANEGIVKVNKTATGWELEPVAGGETIVNAKVGAIEKPITVKVMDAINDIQFYVNGTAVSGTQYPVQVGSEPLTVTWKAIPENADPEQVIDVTSESTDAVVNADSVVVTPKTAGTITINAQTTNKDYVSGTDAANNQQYLKRHLEIVVTAEEITPPPVQGDYNIEIIGKKAIGPSESTDVALLGVADADAAKVTWAITAGSATVEGTGTQVKVVGGETAGLATVAASLDGTVIATAEINVLTAITKITFNETNSYALNKDERVMLVPEVEGYTSVVEDGEEPDLSGIISYSMNAADTAYVRVDYDANGNAYVVGVKQNTKNKTTKDQPYPITAKAYNSVTATINVTMKSNKVNTGFSIPQNGAVLSMAVGDIVTIIPTWEPAKVPATLDWAIEPDDGGITLGGTDEAKTLTIAEGASEIYDVVVSEAGYPDRPAQSFMINVVETAGADATIAYTKIGAEDAVNGPQAATALTLAVGEKIQALLLDADKTAVAGATWSSSNAKVVSVDNAGVVSVLKSAKNAVTISASNGKSFTVKAIKAPAASKFKFAAPATVGVDEEFTVTYEASGYKGDGTNLKNIVASDNEIFAAVDGKANTYKISAPGIVTLTGNTTYGKTPKTVTVTVLPEPEQDVEISGVEKIANGQTIRLKAVLNTEDSTEPGYANITWTVGGNTVTAKKTATEVAGITAKQVANDEIEINATAKAGEGAITVTAKAAGYPDMAEATHTVNAVAADASISGGKVVFEKAVIGVGETTIAHVEMADGTMATGKVTYKAAKSGKTTLATVSGDKITGKNSGAVTVTATLNKTTATGTLYIATKADVSMNNKPTKIAAGKEARVNLKITGYVAPAITGDEEIEASTAGMLTVTSSNPALVDAKIVETVDAAEETDGVVRDYTLVLKAADAVEQIKNTYPTATVTVNQYGKKFQTMKIQVVGETDESELHFPKEIWIAPNTKMALTPSTGDAAEAGVINWKFVENENKAGLSFTKDGKLQAPKGATPGTVSLLEGTAGEQKFELKVTVGKKVTNKNQIKVVLPKTTIGVDEKMMAEVQFTSPYGGAITWKSSKPAVATIDPVTGLIVGKQQGKTTKITAKVAGKTSAAVTLTVGAAPTSIAFEKPEYSVTTAGETVNVKVNMTPAAAQDLTKELGYVIEIDDNTSGLIDEEASDKQAGKIVTSTTATEGSKATLKVTTYNGLTATCMIVYGVTAGGSTGPVTPSTQKLESVKLWLDGYELTTTKANPLSMVEDQMITPNIVAKDDKGIEIPAGIYTLTWDVEDEASKKNVEIAEDGTLTAKLFTTNGATDDVVTVVATVALGEITKTAEYHVSIEPKFSDSHMKFEVTDNKFSLVEGDEVEATLKFDNATYNSLLSNVTVESDSPDNLEVSGPVRTTSQLTYTLKARKAGTAKVIITYIDDQDVEVTKEASFTIVEKPTSEQLSLEPASVMSGVTLVEGEHLEISAILDASFTGTQTADDFGFKYVNKNGEEDSAPSCVSVEMKPLSDTEGEYETGKFIVTAADNVTVGNNTAYIQIEAYKGSAKQTFKVTVLKAPKLSFDMTPKKNKGVEPKDFQAGKGETVTLTLKQEQAKKGDANYASSYSQGLEWVVVYPVPATESSTEPVVKLVPAEDNASAQVTYDGTTKVTIGVKCKNATEREGNIATVDIDYLDVPTADSGVTLKSVVNVESKYGFADFGTTGTITIGKGESVKATLDLGNVYSSKIEWRTLGTSKVALDFADDFAVCKITGLEETAANSTVTVGAYYNDVLLASVKVKVVAQPTKIDLMQDKGKNPFDFVINGEKTVSVKFDSETASADCSLKASVDGIVTIAPALEDGKTSWTLTAKAPGTVTLTLKTSTGLIKRYTAKVS